MNAEAKVLILGAGPVGLTCAAELLRYGVPFRIVDKRPHAVEQTRAGILHFRTQETLEAMGILGLWKREAFALKGLSIRAFGKRVGAFSVENAGSMHPNPLLIGQHATERIFAEHLHKAGVTIERSVEAIDVTPGATEVAVRLRHAEGREETVRAPWVIACEGSKSIAREKAGIAFEATQYKGYEVVYVDCFLRWSYALGQAYGFLDRDRAILTFPWNDEGDARVVWIRRDEHPTDREPPSLADFQSLLRDRIDPQAQVAAPKVVPPFRNRFRLQHALADKLRAGRIFIVGDSAHVHAPVGGQGMNMGIQDAFNLSWKLAGVIQGRWAPEILNSYHVERHAVAAKLLQSTDRIFRQVVNPRLPLRVALRTVVPWVMRSSFFARQARETMGQLKVNYASSPLSEQHGQCRTVNGGRAPDAIIVRWPEGKTIRLFETLRGERWSLLLFTGGEGDRQLGQELRQIALTVAKEFPTTVALRAIVGDPSSINLAPSDPFELFIDRDGAAATAYKIARASLVLVRPDWYVGFRGEFSHAPELLSYLRRIHA